MKYEVVLNVSVVISRILKGLGRIRQGSVSLNGNDVLEQLLSPETMKMSLLSLRVKVN